MATLRWLLTAHTISGSADGASRYELRLVALDQDEMEEHAENRVVSFSTVDDLFRAILARFDKMPFDSTGGSDPAQTKGAS